MPLFLFFSLTKLQRKIFEANHALQFFVTNEWIFKNKNFIALTNEIRLEDDKTFSFREAFQYDLVLYMRYAIRGVKRYLLMDKEENLPRNRIVYARIRLIDTFVKSLPCVVICFFIYIKFFTLKVFP